MVNVTVPANPIQKRGLWPPKDSTEFPVGGKATWWSVAKQVNLDVWVLIEFNFKTRVPEEVNWYLRELVGCKHSTDGRNYAFFGADKSKGKIYVPLPKATLPVIVKKTWSEKLATLKMTVQTSDDPLKSRYLCVLDVMENKRDDRVILWNSIAPDDQTPVPAGVNRRSPGNFLAVDPQWLFDNIKTWQDVANQPLGNGLSANLFVYSLHRFLFDVSDGSLNSLRVTYDSIVETHTMLDLWANQAMGGSSSMPTEYRAIKEFIRLGERRSTGSVMSCIID